MTVTEMDRPDKLSQWDIAIKYSKLWARQCKLMFKSFVMKQWPPSVLTELLLLIHLRGYYTPDKFVTVYVFFSKIKTHW